MRGVPDGLVDLGEKGVTPALSRFDSRLRALQKLSQISLFPLLQPQTTYNMTFANLTTESVMSDMSYIEHDDNLRVIAVSAPSLPFPLSM